MLDSLATDIRFGARTLWKSRGFALISVITLALGVGASTAIFSVIDNVLLEPFPYTAPSRLMTVQIHDDAESRPFGRTAYSGAEFFDYSTQNHVFDGAIGMNEEDVLYTTKEGTHRFGADLITRGPLNFWECHRFWDAPQLRLTICLRLRLSL